MTNGDKIRIEVQTMSNEEIAERIIIGACPYKVPRPCQKDHKNGAIVADLTG